MDILSLEDRMMRYIDFHEKVPSRASVHSRFSFVTDTDALSVVNTCRDRNFDLLPAGGISCSGAVRAFFFYDLTGTVTVGTGLNILDSAEERL